MLLPDPQHSSGSLLPLEAPRHMSCPALHLLIPSQLAWLPALTAGRVLLHKVDAVVVLKGGKQAHNVGVQQGGVDLNLAGHLQAGREGRPRVDLGGIMDAPNLASALVPALAPALANSWLSPPALFRLQADPTEALAEKHDMHQPCQAMRPPPSLTQPRFYLLDVHGVHAVAVVHLDRHVRTRAAAHAVHHARHVALPQHFLHPEVGDAPAGWCKPTGRWRAQASAGGAGA